jgi:hypothetical protein
MLLAGCDGNSDSGGEVEPELSLAFAESPVDLQGILVDFAPDVAYGEGERKLFDIYLPQSDEPTPLVIYVHGGAFSSGDKGIAHEAHANHIREFLQAGIAYATVNYYLLRLDPPDEFGVQRSLDDITRALQFMRYQAANLNIDAENVAMYGVSAGAGSSLWLGTHDELADPGNEDPVLRQSTRIKAAGLLATQSTYDVVDWEQVLLDALLPFEAILGGTDIVTVAAAVQASDLLYAFLSISGPEEIDSPATLAYRDNLDMLEMMDSGDAPIWVDNTSPGFDDLLNLLLHHALHAKAIKERADAVGLPNVVYATDPAFVISDPSEEGLVSFLSRHIR